MVFQLDEGLWFPNPSCAEPNGLLAVGGDLRVERLLLAYSHGIFPWYENKEPILWWCPRERFVIDPDAIHVSRSMEKFMRRHEVKVAMNRDFADTIHRCRLKREDREGTWITDEMEAAYLQLHESGYAASVEAYVDGTLAGGLYGVQLCHCFFGESMFSDLPNGSKLALIALARYLASCDYQMIDCQFHTPHLESMGGVYISYDAFMERIEKGRVIGI